MSAARLRTAFADMNALISLDVPRADADYDTDTAPDSIQYLLTSSDVSVPPVVVSELQDLTQSRYIHGAAAASVLAARDHYTVEDSYERDETPDSRPTFGLDDGETDGIVRANALGVDGFLTVEFGGTNFALVHAARQGRCIVPTPRLLCEYVRNDQMAAEVARRLFTTISPYRGWETGPYVATLLAGFA